MLHPDVYLPKTEWERQQWNKGKAEGKTEGKTEGKAESVLDILEARGIAVSDEQRQQISSCKDLGQLKRWVIRASTVASADELLSLG
jgi:hypothetical protein